MLGEVLARLSAERKAATARPLPRVQPKLVRGSAFAAAERAADSMASQVMAGQTVTHHGLASSEPGLALPPQVASDLPRSQGRGAPLAESVRGHMEPRFGFSFADVRVHNDESAHAMNQALGARAFTYGSDIYLSPQVCPDVNPVMAHELAHVTQQTGKLQCAQPTQAAAQQPRLGAFSQADGLIQRVYAKGQQGYYSVADKKAPNASIPVRRNVPEAELFVGGPSGKPIGTHGLANDKPFWDFGEDGRIVGNPESKQVYKDLAGAGNAAWLQMGVLYATRNMQALGINLIRRIDVQNGADPDAKAPEGAARPLSTSYSCIYEFYKV